MFSSLTFSIQIKLEHYFKYTNNFILLTESIYTTHNMEPAKVRSYPFEHKELPSFINLLYKGPWTIVKETLQKLGKIRGVTAAMR